MVLPKDSKKLKLTNLEGGDLPELEYDRINDPNFLVPFESIKVKEINEFLISGLSNRDVALTQKYLDLINVFSVKIGFQAEGGEAGANLPGTWIVINGRTSVQDLSAMVHDKYGLNAAAELELLVDNDVLPYDKLMASVYKEYLSSDGCLEVFCRFVDGPGN